MTNTGDAMSKKIIIVGGGIAGLSAGIYAQKAGFDSEIYEKHIVAGGQCTGWKRGNFYIDNCISWMTCAKKGCKVYTIWKETGFIGENTLIRQHDAYYTSELNGQKVTLWADLEKAEKELCTISPEDTKKIREFINDVKMAQSLQVPCDKPIDLMNIFELTALGLSMWKMAPVMLKYSKISIEEWASGFKNPVIRKAFMDYLPKDYLAYIFITAYATIASGGGGVPEGGSTPAVNRMVEKYLNLGGKIYTGKPVKEIKIAGNRTTGIILENGDEISGDYVIASCDTHHTFEKLLDARYMPPELVKAYADREANKLGSTFQAAFAYDGKSTIGRRFYYDCSGFNLAGRKITRMNVKNYSAFEPAYAPEGKDLIQVKLLQTEDEYLYWQDLRLNDKARYDAEKKQAAADMERMIVEQFPEAEGKLRLLDVWSPYTYTRFYNAYRGVYMTFIMTKKTKIPLNIPGVIKGIKNVFLAGQWLMLPGGLPVALTSGKFAIQRILKAEGKSLKI